MGNPCAAGSNPAPSANHFIVTSIGGAPSQGSGAAPVADSIVVSQSIGYTRGVVVLDGEVAVPCNPQSAPAGLNSLPRASRVE